MKQDDKLAATDRLVALNIRMGELAKAGEYSEAIQLAHEGRDFAIQVFGKRHPAYAQSINNLGAMYYCAGDLPHALENMREVVEVLRLIVGETHPHFIGSVFNLAQILHESGDDETAKSLYQKVVSLLSGTDGSSTPLFAASIDALTKIERSQNDDYTHAIEDDDTNTDPALVEATQDSSQGADAISQDNSCLDTICERKKNIITRKFPDIRTEDDLVFVIMPFATSFNALFGSLLKPAIEGVGLRCLRADDVYHGEGIVDVVLESILKAGVIVADLTGKNANVFYELGVAHSLGKKVFLVTQSYDDVPFDLRHIQILRYENSFQGLFEFDKIFVNHFTQFVGQPIPKQMIKPRKSKSSQMHVGTETRTILDVHNLPKSTSGSGIVFVDTSLMPNQIRDDLFNFVAIHISEGMIEGIGKDIFAYVEGIQQRLKDEIDLTENEYPQLRTVGQVFNGDPMVAAMHVGRRATLYKLTKTLDSLQAHRNSDNELTAFMIFKEVTNVLCELTAGKWD